VRGFSPRTATCIAKVPGQVNLWRTQEGTGTIPGMSARPLVALTCDHEVVTDRRGQPSPRFVLPESYVAAILAAGGVPLALPHQPVDEAARLLALAQALVITGGDFDVPPSYYGEAPRPKLGRLNEARSAFERQLLTLALARGMPILAVCGGMQLLNVLRGGTLYQDLSERPGTSEHTQPFDKSKPFHAVSVVSGSRLALATGQALLQTNSTHHQAVRQLGEGVRATGLAADGVIEAIELDDQPFALGVQWHPEVMNAVEQLGLYRALIAAA
jgi:putative glutamine amidotransferase